MRVVIKNGQYFLDIHYLCRVVVSELRLGFGHVGSIRLLAVHVLLSLLVPVRLLGPLLLLEHPVHQIAIHPCDNRSKWTCGVDETLTFG